MEAPSSGRGRQAAKREPLLTLKSRPFPGRVRAILETLLGQLSPFLEHGMVDALDALEQDLFRRAEQARSNDVQQRCFESLREVRRIRSDLAPALMALFESNLASLNEPRHPSALAKPARGLRSELSLVESEELEESLIVVDAANRAEVRSSQPLFALGMRFATLAEAPMFEPEDLPVGPHRLSESVRQAAERLALPAEHRLQFFRCVDQSLFARMDRFIDEANRILVESRVLPDLFVLSPRARRPQLGSHSGDRETSPPTVTEGDGTDVVRKPVGSDHGRSSSEPTANNEAPHGQVTTPAAAAPQPLTTASPKVSTPTPLVPPQKATDADVLLSGTTAKFAAQSIRRVFDIQWKATHYIASGAASITGAINPAGPEKAIGVISSAYVKDAGDPEWANDKGVNEYVAFMQKYFPEGNPKDGYCIYAYTVVQVLMQILKQCGDKISRESIMREAQNIKDLEIPTLLPGVKVNISPTNHHPLRQVQLTRWEGAGWKRFGGIIEGANI